MWMKRCWVIAVVIALACAVSVGPIGAAPSQTLVIAGQSGAVWYEAAKQLTEPWAKANGINIEWADIQQTQMRQKLLLEFTSGTGAIDVSAIDGSWIAEFGNAGYLLPLDSYLSPQDRTDFMQGALEALAYGGKLYGLPYDAYVQVLYYRKDLFQKAGLRIPTMQQPYTWDEFRAAAKKLQTVDSAGRVAIWGTISEGKRHPAVLARFIDLLYQAGGRLFDDSGQPAFNSKAGVEAMQFQVDLVYKDRLAPPGALAFDHVDNHTMFMQGQLAMARNHSYAFALINDRSRSKVVDVFDVAPPLKKVRSTTSFGAWGWSVAASSKRRDLGLKWLRFITSQGETYMFQRTALTVPLRKSEIALFERDPAFTPVMRNAVRVFGHALDTGVPRPRLPQWPRVQEVLLDAMVAAMAQQKTPQQALDEAAVQVRAIVNAK